MNKLNVHKMGLGVGAFVGLMHLLWSLVVAFGLAQGLLNFIFSMHFLNNPYTVAAFSWSGALGLVVLTAVVGYIIGSVFATVWNKISAR